MRFQNEIVSSAIALFARLVLLGGLALAPGAQATGTEICNDYSDVMKVDACPGGKEIDVTPFTVGGSLWFNEEGGYFTSSSGLLIWGYGWEPLPSPVSSWATSWHAGRAYDRAYSAFSAACQEGNGTVLVGDTKTRGPQMWPEDGLYSYEEGCKRSRVRCCPMPAELTRLEQSPALPSSLKVD